jgi:hypothetical protein
MIKSHPQLSPEEFQQAKGACGARERKLPVFEKK